MSWQGRSDLGIGIREIALFLTVIFILLSYWVYSDQMSFEWQLLLTAAGSTASVWITLVVIERVIREDREQQWEKVKSLTYLTILNDIRYIVTEVPIETGNAIDCINLINGEINYPSDFTSNIISDLTKEMRAEYECEDDLLDMEGLNEERLKDVDIKTRELTHFCKKIDHVLEDLRITLIPRTLRLSNDPEVNLALTRFEAFIREFQKDVKNSWGLSDIANPVIQLFEESGKLYDVLQRKIPPQNGGFAYRFKVPPPIY